MNPVYCVIVKGFCLIISYYTITIVGISYCIIIRALQYIDISSYRGINKATIPYLGPTNRNRDTEISIILNI